MQPAKWVSLATKSGAIHWYYRVAVNARAVEHTAAYFQLAILCTEINDWQQALTWYQKAADQGNNLEAQLWLARYFRDGKYTAIN